MRPVKTIERWPTSAEDRKIQASSGCKPEARRVEGATVPGRRDEVKDQVWHTIPDGRDSTDSVYAHRQT